MRHQESPPHVKSGTGTTGVHPRDDSGVRVITEADAEELPDHEPPEELPPETHLERLRMLVHEHRRSLWLGGTEDARWRHVHAPRVGNRDWQR